MLLYKNIYLTFEMFPSQDYYSEYGDDYHDDGSFHAPDIGGVPPGLIPPLMQVDKHPYLHCKLSPISPAAGQS